MHVTPTVETVPLVESADGVIRVADTRVTLDTVIAAFREGATAEEITHQYPVLALPDVYAVITFFLRHADQVEDYLARRQELAGEIRKDNEVKFDPSGIRERLLARRTSQ